MCTVSGSTVTFVGAGTCVVNANQAGNTDWNAAPQVQQSFTVGKGSQTISFTSTAPSGAVVGGATYTVTATATSGLTVVFTSGSIGVCTVSGSTVSFVGAGTCVVNANQAGNTNWNAAPQVQQSFTVNTATFAITSVAGSGGSKKVSFSGTGAVAGTTITVSICTVDTFPCPGGSGAGTSSLNTPTGGSWTSGQSGPANLSDNVTYYARAVQGAATSAVFSFTVTTL
ncbi:MAG: hypothetical protein ACRDYV_12125 [Acidimicrobiia bacterium]